MVQSEKIQSNQTMDNHCELKCNYSSFLLYIKSPTSQPANQPSLHIPFASEGTISVVYFVCCPSPKFPSQVPLPLENYCA